jgi:hypothetical protein
MKREPIECAFRSTPANDGFARRAQEPAPVKNYPAATSIGTATLAAFVGAGGLAEPIVAGLALNDPQLILQGAIPAALLAFATELVFEFAERRFVPAHLRRSASGR